MNLKNRFRLVIFSMFALLVIVTFVGVIALSHTNAHIREAISMDNIVADLYEMRILNSEYLAVPSERVKQQWQIKYLQIRNRLPEQRAMPDDVKEAFNGLQDIFGRLVAIPEPSSDAELSEKRLKNQLATFLNLESQRIIDWASDISKELKNSVAPHMVYLAAVTFVIIIIAAVIVIVMMFVTARHVISSINRLKLGAEEIASGKLGIQVEFSGNDEIALLAGSVNRMSSDLTASFEALHDQTVQLEKEMAERQKTFETLKMKSVELEHEIAERMSAQQNLEEQKAMLEAEILERIRIQEEHDHLEDLLRQSQKMEAIGLLAGGVAHDFNNILSVIMGYGSLLMGHLPKGRAYESAEQILKASERAAELTRGLLAFSMKQTFNLERTDINQLASDNIKFLKRVIGEDIKLVTTFHPAPLPIMLDHSQIQQVFMNLATNARDAMPSGGSLTIVITRENPDDNLIALQNSDIPMNYAHIRVSDTGGGMDQKTVERIFEPFFTTKEKGKGTGLGLSIIHGIIAQHKGFIFCSSEPGSGTEFSVYLPLCADKAPTALSASPDPKRSLRGSETILLAEDDRALMEITANCLELYGYRVLQAFDGNEAVKIFEKQGGGIDMVMLDAIMPKMTGKQALDEIRALRPDVRACFVSGYASEIISGKVAVDNSLPLISKPIMPEKLLLKVREILDGTTQESP